MRLAAIAVSALVLMFGSAPAMALSVESRVSAEFQKKLESEFGVREASVLTEILTRKINSVFAAKGVKAERVVVTIEDARPNRPTMKQVSAKPGLDPINSFGVGGARVSGIAYDAAGQEIGKFDYDWYETDLNNVVAPSTWSDARTSFDRFARRFAEKIT